MSSDPHRPVSLRVSNHKAYVWDVEDIATLRARHHVCGVLTGTLPHLSQQNVFLGVPLLLMPEEVVLLVEKQLAVLVDDTHAHPIPSPESLQRWNDARIESVQAKIAAAASKEAQDKAAQHAMSEDALRKRREREARRAAVPAGTTAPAAPSDDRAAPPTAPAYTVSVPARSSALPWYAPERATYTTLAAARAAGVWAYPADLHERAKCGVFRDLWEQGLFMGGGIRFGGDFLVYPGDPLRYHSHFAATVLDAPTSVLKPMEIVAHGRLGTATKKAHLLCGWDDEKQEVSYFSIEWASFG